MESTEYREVYFLGRLSSKTSFLASFFYGLWSAPFAHMSIARLYGTVYTVDFI